MLLLPLAINWIGAVLLFPLDGRRRWVKWLAAVILSASLASASWLAREAFRNRTLSTVIGGWEEGVGITLSADPLGITFVVLANFLLLVTIIYEDLYEVEERAFPSLVLFLAAGLNGLFLTRDAFNFYVFFEISMTASFILATYGQEPREVRDALTFLVTNLIGSALFLSGVVGLYRLTGTLDMGEISIWVATAEPTSVILVSALIFVAMSVKLGLFPFHFWLPAVYRGLRPVSAAILSGVLANIGSYGLLRFGVGMLALELQFAAPLLSIIGAASIVYGAFLALSRRTLRETLAYSSISQAGYILLAIVLGSPLGYSAAVLYTIINAVNKTMLFLATGLRGWLVGVVVAIGAFSVAGIPPAVGFFGKTALFRAGADSGSPALALGVMFLGSALSIIYMFQIYQRRFWIPESENERPSPLRMRLLLLFLAVVVLGLGVWPEPLLQVSSFAIQVLTREVP